VTISLTLHEEHVSMKILFDEIRTRFPEFIEEVEMYVEVEYDAPYLAMGYLADWLDSKGENGFDPTIVQRLVDFAKWCESQPRGKDASDDIYTILYVAMYEALFLRQHTKCLIPRLMSKKDLEENKQYLVSWVGQDNYDKALEQFQE
jgi:hypothetical protein